jgi:hypothetical protein
MIRRFFRSKLLGFSLLGLGFVAWSWFASMQGTRGVSWRSGDRAVFLAVSDGSVRVGFEGSSRREASFDQWSVPRGQYTYSNNELDRGWFAAGGIRRHSGDGRLVAMPHWLLAALLLAMAVGTRLIQRWRRRRIEREVAAEILP